MADELDNTEHGKEEETDRPADSSPERRTVEGPAPEQPPGAPPGMAARHDEGFSEGERPTRDEGDQTIADRAPEGTRKETATGRGSGFVYLMQMADHYKIGSSKNPQKRLGQFSGMPHVVRLIHSFASKQAVLLERTLHNRFSSQQVRGEWFVLTKDDVASICSIKECNTPEDLPAVLKPLTPLPKKDASKPGADSCGLWKYRLEVLPLASQPVERD